MFHCGDGAAYLGAADVDGGTAYRFRCRHGAAELSYTDSP
jgi:hypothetical protein